MSRLEKLIAELCPDGVEYKTVGEIASCQKRKNKNHITENAYSITQRGLLPTNDFFGEKTHITSKDTSGYYMVYKNWFVYSPSRIDVGSINYLREEGPVIVSPLDVVFSVDVNAIKPNFLLNILLSHNGMFQILNLRRGIEGTGRKLLPFSEMAKIKIPVPPLDVQHETLRILDNFTELTAELTARKKQYEYYRETILTQKFAENSQEMTIGEVYDFQYGTGNVIPTSGGVYPVYGSNGIVGNHSIYNSEDSPVIGHIGAYAGIVNWGKGKHFVTYNGVICKHKNAQVNSKYAYYLLLLQDFGSKSKNNSQPFISYDILKAPKVIIPSLPEQQRIVSYLDRFDALCNDISAGLPAEIEARKKQYEYYRDKLLTFKELDK